MYSLGAVSNTTWLNGTQCVALSLCTTTSTSEGAGATLALPGTWSTKVYEVSCHGSRPAVQMTAHPVGAAWQACANRRLTCTNGFVHRDGAQMSSPHMGACGVYP